MSGVAIEIEQLYAEEVHLPLEEPRAIAWGTDTHADVIRVEVRGAGCFGRGEAQPMGHYGDSILLALSQLEDVREALLRGTSREGLSTLLPPGGARNALDAALWDLEAAQTGRDAVEIAGVGMPHSIVTAYTIPIKSPAEVAEVAEREQERPLIKVKLGHYDDDRARLEAIRRAAPDADLIVDANEGWTFPQLAEMGAVMHDLGVKLVEQPLRAGDDAVLLGFDCGVPLCADESCHTPASLDMLQGRYAYINIKLDKSGGLTEALTLAREARNRGFGLMVGCTSGTTLSIAPAFLLAQFCTFCDLDAPLFLASREEEELVYDGSRLNWSPSRRWGTAAR